MSKITCQVYSPDGFEIDPAKTYSSLNQAKKALQKFVKKYEFQGFYSTIINGERQHIELKDLPNYCTIELI